MYNIRIKGKNLSKNDKLLKELENNPKNVKFEVLEKLLLNNGFNLRGIKKAHIINSQMVKFCLLCHIKSP